MKKKRNNSIEVLRCVLMFLIVLHHCTCLRAIGDTGHRVDWLFTDFTAWHVDCFVVISGWFGISLSIWKFVRIWGLLVYSTALSVGYSLILGHGFAWKTLQITGGWFGGSYLMLMLMTPILNAGVEKLQSEGALRKGLAVLCLGVFAFYMPANFMTGIAPHMVASVSFFTIMFVYLVARSLRLLAADLDFEKWVKFSFVAYPVGFVGVAFIACAASRLQGRELTYDLITNYTSSYLAPHTVVMALSVFLLFLNKVRLPMAIDVIGRFLGPSMFSVYLLHHTTTFGKLLYQIPQKWLAGWSGLSSMMIIFISAVLTFLVCVAIDLVRRGCVVMVVYICSRYGVLSKK